MIKSRWAKRFQHVNCLIAQTHLIGFEWPLKRCTSALLWHISWSRALQSGRTANPESFFFYSHSLTCLCITIFTALLAHSPVRGLVATFVWERWVWNKLRRREMTGENSEESVWLWYSRGSPRAAELSWALVEALNCGKEEIDRRERWQVVTSETRTDWKDLRSHPKWCLMV